MTNIKRLRVSEEERAEMDSAVADGLAAIFDDFSARGIANAREIYAAIDADCSARDAGRAGPQPYSQGF